MVRSTTAAAPVLAALTTVGVVAVPAVAAAQAGKPSASAPTYGSAAVDLLLGLQGRPRRLGAALRLAHPLDSATSNAAVA
jgi:hypothetical protein